MTLKQDAVTWCGYIRPDRTCAIMEALASETDPRCKLWRNEPQDCRYLRLHAAKRRGRK